MTNEAKKIKEIHDKMHELTLKDNCYYDFQRLGDQMLSEINVLIATEKDETKVISYRHALSAVAHTLGKEVEYIKYHQDAMHKKNAARKRADEYRETVAKAVKRIYIDIMHIL